MRRDRQGSGAGHPGDLEGAADPAQIADVGLDDIDRVIKTVAGEQFHPRSLETAVNAAWAEGNLYEDDYYRIRGFKKGSMHIQFKRADLLEKVNDLIAEHYGSNALAAA